MAVAEIEPFPCAVLAHHYPDVPNLGDVTKTTEEDIKNLGQIDLVVFGSPCQNLSVAGNRKGLQGESSSLFYEAIRIFEYARKHCNARFALWENVPGAFSSNKGDDFREVVRELSANRDINTPQNGWGNTGVALGENGLVEWRVLDAQYFGLAQRRKRVFAVLDTGNWRGRPPILLEPKSLCGDTPPSRETWQKVASNTQTGVRGKDNTIYGLNSQQPPARLTKECCDALVASNYKEPMGVLCVHGSQDPITSETTANCLGRNQGLENVVAYSIIADTTPKIGDEICGTLRSEGGGGIVPPSVAYGFDTKQHTPKVDKELTQTLVATGHKEPLGVVSIAGNIIGRSPQNGGNGNGFDEEVCYTLTTADRHAVATNSIIRRLTPTECERLQGFPDNYTQIPYRNKSADQCPDSPRYKALGNSMAVPAMRWIGERISCVVGGDV